MKRLLRVFWSGMLMATGMPVNSALADIFILHNQELIESDPHRDEIDLRGKQVWLGGLEGGVGSAKFIKKGDSDTEIILNEEFGPDAMLGYDAKATFLPLHAKPISDPALTQEIGKRAKTANDDVSDLEIVEVARVDLNGDGHEELITRASTPRAKSDPYAGKRSDFEGLFVAAPRGNGFEILGEVIATPHEDKDIRTNIDVLAIGQNPQSGAWEILTKRESHQSGTGPFNLTVTVNGETTSSSDSRSMSKNVLLEVYRSDGGALSGVKALAHPYFFTCFGTGCD